MQQKTLIVESIQTQAKIVIQSSLSGLEQVYDFYVELRNTRVEESAYFDETAITASDTLAESGGFEWTF